MYKKKSINYAKIIALVLCLILLLLLTWALTSQKSQEMTQGKQYEESSDEPRKQKIIEAKKNPPRSFTLTGLGDVMCHNTQFKDAYVSTSGVYDFNYVFDNIKDLTSQDDITIANLETTFAGPKVGYSGYPTFNTPDALGEALKNIGIDVLSTANNHCMDSGYSGLTRTLDVLDQIGIEHTGTSRTPEEQNKTLIKDINGIKVGILSFTYDTNGINPPSSKIYCVNYINKDFIKQRINAAKSEGAEIIIACMHWGIEYRTTPSSDQIDLSDFLFKNGVDIILGNHAHVVEPFELREVTMEDGTIKQCFVVYAMGNFVANQSHANTRNSIIMHMKVTIDSDGKTIIDDITYAPVYIYRNTNISIRQFKLLKIDGEIANYESGAPNRVNSSLYSILKEERGKINKTLGQ